MTTKRTRYLEGTQWHHVFNRGADGQDIFSLDGDRSLFENLIGETLSECAVEVHAFALMTNHYHFLIRDPDCELSGFMQYLAGQYASKYNARTQRHGPLFDGRFGSVPIVDEAQLIAEARYVERNPLAFVAPNNLAAYAHASLGVYLGRRNDPGWLTTDELAPRIDGLDYLDYVLADRDTDAQHSARFTPLRPISAREIESVVDALVPDDARTARLLSIVVTIERRAATTAELAARHRISPAGVRQLARRARVRRDTDPVFSRLHARVQQQFRIAS